MIDCAAAGRENCHIVEFWHLGNCRPPVAGKSGDRVILEGFLYCLREINV